jgi:hypothetical protein
VNSSKLRCQRSGSANYIPPEKRWWVYLSPHRRTFNQQPSPQDQDKRSSSLAHAVVKRKGATMYENQNTFSLSFLTTKNTERCITHMIALFLLIYAQSLDRELRGYIYEVNYIWMTLHLSRNCVTSYKKLIFYTY